MGWVTVNAKKLDADLSKLPASSENTTWSWNSGTSTGTFGWSDTSWNSTELFSAGNYSAYTTLNFVTTTGTADHFRVILRFTNGKGQVTINSVSTGTQSITLSDYATAVDLANIGSIRLSGANDVKPGNVKVTSIYLEGPDLNYIEATKVFEAPTGTTDLNGITGAGTIKWTISYPQDVKNETLWGGDIDSDAQSVNIEDYDYLHFVVSTATADAHTGLRVFVWDGTKRVCLYPHPIEDCASVTDWTATTWITTPGTYVVKISDYPLLRGFKALQGWAGNAGSISVASAYVSKENVYLPNGKYSLVGEATGSVTLNAALADASATLYDATGLTNVSAVALNPTNPNAFFVVSDAAKLSNTKNVLVKSGDNYSSSNIELVDDKPFNAPFDILSTASSYTRNFDAAEAWGSAVLPFAMNVDDENNKNEAKFYMFKSATATTASFEEVKTGIIPANSPFIYQATGNSVKFVGTNISKTVSGYDLVLIGDGWYMAQSMESKVIDDVTTDDFFKDYDVYGISGADFVRATKKLTLKPFRAFYLKEKTGGEAPARLTIEIEEEATAITEVASEANGDGVVYNLAGQPVGDDYKGVVIKNGKKYIQ